MADPREQIEHVIHHMGPAWVETTLRQALMNVETNIRNSQRKEGETPPTCGTCRFWSADDRRACRRFPPNVQGYVPQTAADSWCGEHQPKTPTP